MGNFNPTIDFVSTKTHGGISFFERILAYLDMRMSLPSIFGWYHILCLVITIGLCVLVYFIGRKLSDKSFNLILGITAITMIVLEAYKQVNFSYDVENDTWSYQWYAFPFQFCATPMYVMALAALLKEGKLKNMLCSYLATYGLFAGLVVMLYPSDVFTSIIGINIQTMIHHGVMVVLGVLMYVSGRVKFSHKVILHGLPVFASFVGLATVANILFHYFGPADHTFNMFYISPYYPCTLPVLSMFYGKVPYLVFLIIYVGGFTLAGYVMSLIAMGISKLRTLILKKINVENDDETMKNYV